MLGALLVVVGSGVLWRTSRRLLEPEGSSGWTWGEGFSVAVAGLAVAITIPTYHCPAGYVLTPVFHACASPTSIIIDPPTRIGWKLAVAALGLVLGAGGFWWWLQGLSTMGGAGSEVAGRKPVAGEGALPVGALEEFQVVSEEELWDAELEPEGSGRGIRWSTKTIELDPAVYEKKVPRGDRAARLYLELERIDNFRLERTDNFRFARLEYR